MFGVKGVEFQESPKALVNPLMGYAPPADNPQESAATSLVYVDITWRELEPREGVYDWDTIEDTNYLPRWREEGKHVVLRFLCDVPGDEKHMDIPDWLYEKMEGAGDWYDMDYGKGYSPDYGNEIMIAAHEQAVRALGEHFGADDFVSYVELGSLGHWGEWHVNYSAGIRRLPTEEIRNQYVTPWAQYFPQSRILMRRPFLTAKQGGFGLYNDMAGEPDSTEQWLQWIEEGGIYNQTDERSMAPMEDYWKQAPVGGELTSSIPMSELLGEQLERTIVLVSKSHTTFLGPKIGEREYLQGYDTLLKNMGYRIWVKEAKIKIRKDVLKIQLEWKNTGAAPIYWDWEPALYLKDKGGNLVVRQPVSLKLSQLLPGDESPTVTRIESPEVGKILRQGGSLSLGICDPATGEPGIHFAVQGQEESTLLKLY